MKEKRKKTVELSLANIATFYGTKIVKEVIHTWKIDLYAITNPRTKRLKVWHRVNKGEIRQIGGKMLFSLLSDLSHECKNGSARCVIHDLVFYVLLKEINDKLDDSTRRLERR